MGKETEAEQHIKAAKKAAKSGFLKKPDWDTAAGEYEKAAQIYTHLKHLDEARAAWQAAAEAHYAAENYYFAARGWENISRLCEEKKDFVGASDALERAAPIYAEDNKPDKHAETWMKAGRVLLLDDAALVNHADRAVKDLREALDIYAGENLWHLMGEAHRILLNLLVKLNRLPDAAAAVRAMFKGFVALKQPHNLHKGYLELVVLGLAMDDYVAAERAYQEACSSVESFRNSDEGSVALDLTSAWDQRDQEHLVEVQKNQNLNFLSTEVAKLARKLRITGPPRPRPALTGLDAAPDAGGDEFEENLC